jgi:pectate lyase
VRVSNTYGISNSSAALLVVSPIPTAPLETNLLGWAAFADVTGGSFGGSTTVEVATNYYWFSNFVRRPNALTIQVPGTITNEELYCYVYGNNKTIIGMGTNASFIGDLRLNATNIIVQNLFFTGGTNDLITIDGGSKGTGKNIWIDHCTFSNAPDGSVDITKGADYVTVSWSRFEYAPKIIGNAHEYVDLIGSSDSDDASQFHVTFHHNWYSTNCIERMPSVRFGRVHVFNNYYTALGNNYCVRTRINAEVLVENNFYLGVQNPWERFVTSGTPGKLRAIGNITNNCTFVNGWVSGAVVIPGDDTLGSDLNPPPYTYTMNPAVDVPYYIQTYAGHGKFPYVP